MAVGWSSNHRQTRTKERCGWCTGCRRVSDLRALESKLAAVTTSIKEHIEGGFFCLEASSWRPLPVSVICRIVHNINNETIWAFWQSFNIAIFWLVRASMPTFFSWGYLKKFRHSFKILMYLTYWGNSCLNLLSGMKLNKTATKKQKKKKKEKYKRKKKHFVPFTVCLSKTSFAKLLRERTEY